MTSVTNNRATLVMSRLLVCVLALSVALGAPLAGAVVELFEFATPAQEAQYKRLVDELRCPKCLNTNLSGSNGPIAGDLRREVYEQVTAGRSDDEIRDFMQARYGDFILYRPPLNYGTVVLWGLPIFLLIVALMVVLNIIRSNAGRVTEAVELSPEDAATAAQWLDTQGEAGRR